MPEDSSSPPVTRHDLDEAVQTIKAYIDERSERIETKLLTAFHGWARSMEIRVRNSSAMNAGFDERLALLEERVSNIERKAS